MDLDWWGILLRFFLYLDLMILFGIPLFSLYSLENKERSTIPGRILPIILFGCTLLGVAL